MVHLKHVFWGLCILAIGAAAHLLGIITGMILNVWIYSG